MKVLLALSMLVSVSLVSTANAYDMISSKCNQAEIDFIGKSALEMSASDDETEQLREEVLSVLTDSESINCESLMPSEPVFTTGQYSSYDFVVSSASQKYEIQVNISKVGRSSNISIKSK